MSQREKLIIIHPTTQEHLSGLSGQPQTPHVPMVLCVLASVQLPGESEPSKAFQGLILQSQKNLRAEMGQLSDRGWAWFAVAAEGWGHHGVTSSPMVAAAIPGSPSLSVLFRVRI